MCGILGIVNPDGLSDIDRHFVEAGTELMAHRGPDGQGVWFGSHAGFGHRRLAVIDLLTGDQPMHDATVRYGITFNGEIYNFQELRKELEQKGRVFLTNSDTEVILNAYACWGPACVERFNGIFAFALWDSKERTLFLARDHMGVKPLFYSVQGRLLLFSSELKAIMKHPAVQRDIDVFALSDYLSLGYVLTPKTIIKNIMKLPPATRLVWKNGTVTLNRYWDLASVANQTPSRFSSEEEAIEALNSELDRAVRTQLVSDVPVGSFLSGGLDSSAVTQRMVSFYPSRVQTFSIGFKEKSYSELPYARLAADYLRTEHHDKIIFPDVESVLSRLAWFYDEPFSDTSTIPTYLLCQFASSRLKVVLSGDGGDECFAGYDTYLADKAQLAYKKFAPRFLQRSLIEPLAAALPANHDKVSWNYKLKHFVAHADSTAEEGHYSWRLIFPEAEKKELLTPETLRDLGDYSPFQTFLNYYSEVPQASALGAALYVDAKTWLADAMLVKVDRASMATGLEVRVPLLDHKLVEFATALPANYKLKGWRTKAIFKAAMTGKLPRAIINRRKRGFNAPAAHWVKNINPALFRSDGALTTDRSGFVDRLMLEHKCRREDNGFKLWTLLNWSLWHKSVMNA